MGLKSGALRHRVDLMRLSDEPDPDTGERGAWTKLATVWAAVEPDTANGTKESFSEGKRTSKTRVMITLRWSSQFTLTSADRIYFDNNGQLHIYELESITNRAMRNFALECLCYELDAQG